MFLRVEYPLGAKHRLRCDRWVKLTFVLLRGSLFSGGKKEFVVLPTMKDTVFKWEKMISE